VLCDIRAFSHMVVAISTRQARMVRDVFLPLKEVTMTQRPTKIERTSLALLHARLSKSPQVSCAVASVSLFLLRCMSQT
jgi:hypothetical protein